MDALTQLTVIWGAVLVSIVAAQKTRLTPVLYFLAAGFILANTGVLPAHHDPFIDGFGEIGIILIMFALGFEEDTRHFVQSLRMSWGIAFFGGLAPFLAAYGVSWFIWRDTQISLMCGLTMTATAVSLTMVSLRSEGLGKSSVATRIMTSAVIDDIASLALVAILVPIASGEVGVDPLAIGLTVAKALGFFVLITFLGAWILPHAPRGWIGRLPVIRSFGLRHVFSLGDDDFAMLPILLLALVVGVLAHEFGLHPAVGAYMAGLVVKEEYFVPREDRGPYLDTKRMIDNVAFVWIGPVFFVNLGTELKFDADLLVQVIPYVVAMTLAIFVAQVVSAATAARYTGGMTWSAGLMVGFGMLGRAELAFVVLDIAYVQKQILSPAAFYTLMLSAFWLNLAVPLTIRFWKPRYEASRSTTP